jgi:hypothetical protein
LQAALLYQDSAFNRYWNGQTQRRFWPHRSHVDFGRSNANRSGWLEKTCRLHRVHLTSLASQKNASAATAANQPPPEKNAAPIAKPRTASVVDQTIFLRPRGMPFIGQM